MVGDPPKIRPLSFDSPKPLFPLAWQPMVHHCISTCKRIPNLAQIFLIGFYQEQEFALYVSSITNELKVPVRYLKEDKPHGSAAGLYYFRDMIQNCAVYYVVVLICAVIRKNGEPLRCILITSISFGAVTYLSAELRCLPQFFKNGEFGEFTLCMMYVKLACDLVTGHI